MNEDNEPHLVQEFFGGATGYFVEVGANDPRNGSQSWHLEKRSWNGILIEPQPELADKLRQDRRAKVFAVACSTQENDGRKLPFYVAGPMSALDRGAMAPGSQPKTIIDVPARTLNSVLAEAGTPQPIDFLLSIDVEGHEIEVMRGFDFIRWQPRLVLLEDHVGNLRKHQFMKSSHYRLVRRSGHNGWHVPKNSQIHFGFIDRWQVFRKYYLALP
jgi:FkbM family methyltransferase